MSSSLQLNSQQMLRHFLAIEGLPQAVLTRILSRAETYLEAGITNVYEDLQGKTVVNLFFEASTRTRCSFELAANRLSANVLNIDIAASSTTKGETLLDTIRTIEAMGTDVFVIRHQAAGAAHFIAQHCQPHIAVLNAGDGQHEHPTQAMLDMLAIQRIKGEFPGLTVVIIGDILHSRVARSQIYALSTLGASEIRVIAPPTLLPIEIERMGVRVFHNIDEGLMGADVVIALRLQKERMCGHFLPSERSFFQEYGLTIKRLGHAKPDAIVLHPAPLNRGIEISSEVADGYQSQILAQVTDGVAVRMAVMAEVMETQTMNAQVMNAQVMDTHGEGGQ